MSKVVRLLGCACLPLATSAVAAEERTVRVSERTCADLVRHTASEDVAYEPGVDVHGDPVEPAELGGGASIEAPDAITIPLRVELLETGDVPDGGSDRPVADAGVSGDARVGTVTVDLETGRAYYNGEPLTSRARRRLAEKCQDRDAGQRE